MTKTAPTPIDPLVLAPSQRPNRPGAAEKATMFDALLAARRQQDVGQSLAEPPPRAPAMPERERAAPSLAKATADRQPDTRPDLRRSASRADALAQTQAQPAGETAATAPDARATEAVLVAESVTGADLAIVAEAGAPVEEEQAAEATVVATVVSPQDAATPHVTKTDDAAAALGEAPEVAGAAADANQISLGAATPVIAPAAAAPTSAATPALAIPVTPAPVAPAAPVPVVAPDLGAAPVPAPVPAAAPVVDPAAAPVVAAAPTVAAAVSAPTVGTTARASTTAVATPVAPVSTDGDQAAAVPAPVQPLATTQPATTLTPAMAEMADDLAKLAPNTPVTVQVAAAAANAKPVTPAPVAIDGKSIVAIADAARSGRATGTMIDRPVEAIVRAQPLPGESLLAPSTLGDLPPQAPPRLSGAAAFQTLLANVPDAAETALPSPVAGAAQPTSGPQAANAAQQAAPTRPHRPIPVVDQVATGVFRAATEGGGKVTIGLTPQNLGRVEVEIEVKDGSKVTAVVVAERQETLELLRRDAHTLERALADAGLKTDSNSLQFHLRGQARDDGDSPRQRTGRGGGLAGDTTPDDPTPTRQQRYGGALGGVDVTI